MTDDPMKSRRPGRCLHSRHLVFQIIVGTVCVSWACAVEQTPVHTKTLPHVVIILADDMGYGDPQCYNPNSRIPTPNIDRMAREGTLFTDAHSSSGVCTPTRYALLTGGYSWRTPKKHAIVMPYEAPLLTEGQFTLAEMFKRRGYRTACIGKWHLGLRYPVKAGAPNGDVKGYTDRENHIDFAKDLEGGPLDHGFDRFFGSAGCVSSDPPYVFIQNRRAIAVPDRLSPEELNVLPGFYPGLMDPEWKVSQVDVRLTEEAVQVIAEEGRGTSPLLLYFALNTPHIPWEAPEMFEGKSQVGSYGDMIQLADWAVGRVLAALEAQNMLNDTLVIFTSDNGPPRHAIEDHTSAGPFRGQKNTIWEGGHRVPFLIRWPDKIAGGRESDQVLCLTDLMASFAAMLGIALPVDAGPDSFNVLPALLDYKTRCERPHLINDTSRGDVSLRQGEWKYIALADKTNHKGPRKMLFNLQDDPEEEHNLAETMPGKLEAMQEMLDSLMSTPSTRHRK